jgi:hypothetical protein
MEFQISRRDLIRGAAGTTVVKAVGIGGLFSLLANRQAVAAGSVFMIVGFTGEVGQHQKGASEPAHRHSFTATFTLQQINPDNGVIIGDIAGQTVETIATGHNPEDAHVHPIQVASARIEQRIATGVEDGHFHRLHVD